MNTLLISDEAHLHMSGFMNKENCRYWAPNNPHEHQEGLLHNAKVTAWCSISSHGSNGSPFFKNAGGYTVTVNTVRYKVMLETFLQNGLYLCQIDLVCFRQDGATAHMADAKQVLSTMFPGRLPISCFGGHHLAHPIIRY
jgi:hypothetical protein